MGKPGGLGLFMGRRKSSLNALDGPELHITPEAADSGGFRVLTQTEVQRVKQEKETKKAQERSSSKFPRFSGFGGVGNKTRNQSYDEDSLASSKRDSKSSSGTHASSSRPYHNGHYGSTSTLPSSADIESNDSMFSGLPSRPPVPHYGSSPSSLTMSSVKKHFPTIPQPPKSSSAYNLYDEQPATSPATENGRTRALTTSSYASTAIPPKLDSDLNFGGGFDDMFTSLDRRASPDFTKEPTGRSLLGGKRAFQAEPIKIDRQLEVEPALQSWDSRGSDDNLMSPPSDKDDYSPPPPPVPAHKYSSKYAPVASDSPDLNGEDFEDRDARLVRQSFLAQKPAHRNGTSREPNSLSTSSAASLQTPTSSSSASNHNTPRAVLHPIPSHVADDEDDEDNEDIFAAPNPRGMSPPKPAAPVTKEPTPARSGEPRRMTEAEFKAHQAKQTKQPTEDSSDEEDDYEDEDELIERRQKEEQQRRVLQQQQLARIHLQRATTTDPNQRVQSTGFPSEVSLQADEWDDEEVPLGVLVAHGFPSSTRQPTQPQNAAPSYFRTNPSGLPDRPSSAGPMGGHAPSGYRPPFARGLPDDPYSTVIGGGLVRPMNRESMGFSRGPASAYGEPMMPYHEPNAPPSLVERIHMSELSKPKYNGGASSKNPLQGGGPFTGSLGTQMNGMGQSMNPTRMPMQGMPGMQTNGGSMMGMMGGQQMPMMGMNQMGFPSPQSELQQMQQMVAFQQQQIMQMQMYGQQYPQMQMQDPRMSVMQPNLGNGNFMNFPTGNQNQRPMSVMSQTRPYSTPSQFGTPRQQGGFQMGGLAPPNVGYSASIAPSERSNIGLSARYRPVATGAQDSASNVSSSMTLQASSGANQATILKTKGILKNKSPQIPAREEEDEDWGRMAARKNKFGKAKGDKSQGLQDLAQAVDSF
ncbi:hypothetical protein K504DRAFT_454608 [Pleomassaria siparia CBS 279.74]|uniref:Uncharacterized protein n=1 Tax=Pleomassaria siparia CBS 279.74 TaxID=1314801 RepID=A0A6G1KBY8_9PLEO|nr:hypothetical protein K504DRAFT_454608 [Pleomassaria siparia CBS 279.74]